MLCLLSAFVNRHPSSPSFTETRLEGFLPLTKYLKSFNLSSWRKSLTESDGSQDHLHGKVELMLAVNYLVFRLSVCLTVSLSLKFYIV